MRSRSRATVLALLVPAAGPARAREAFSIDEGDDQNRFHRDDDVAAHAVVSARGPRGRVVVAFPAGDGGIGVWVEGESALSLAECAP